jgi:predicted deacetylase
MSARYLIRLDDACDTMDRRKWRLIEEVFDRHAIRPIVAVVPDNQDPALVFDSQDDGFWKKVRAWQAKGWSVAMHGHTHVMQATRSPLLVPFYQRSEFAGLEFGAQKAKIGAAWRHFLAEGVKPEIWVGPAHSFDLLTLRALREETSINVVSDGIALDTYFEHEFYWIPQQLWRMARRSTGLWTVCLHPNDMTESAIAALDSLIGTEFRRQIVGRADVQLRKRRKSLLGAAYHQYFWWRWRRQPQAAAWH